MNLLIQKTKTKKKLTLGNVNRLFRRRQKLPNGFKNNIFLLGKQMHEKGLKILTPEQGLQRLPIILAQVKARNTSKGVLNIIRQIIYSLYRAK